MEDVSTIPDGDNNSDPVVEIKRGRGRPKKIKMTESPGDHIGKEDKNVPLSPTVRVVIQGGDRISSFTPVNKPNHGHEKQYAKVPIGTSNDTLTAGSAPMRDMTAKRGRGRPKKVKRHFGKPTVVPVKMTSEQAEEETSCTVDSLENTNVNGASTHESLASTAIGAYSIEPDGCLDRYLDGMPFHSSTDKSDHQVDHHHNEENGGDPTHGAVEARGELSSAAAQEESLPDEDGTWKATMEGNLHDAEGLMDEKAESEEL